MTKSYLFLFFLVLSFHVFSNLDLKVQSSGDQLVQCFSMIEISNQHHHQSEEVLVGAELAALKVLKGIRGLTIKPFKGTQGVESYLMSEIRSVSVMSSLEKVPSVLQKYLKSYAVKVRIYPKGCRNLDLKN